MPIEQPPEHDTRFVVMGVAGSGKSEIGRRLAGRMDCAYIEGDDYHPAANVAKMASGTPLDDADRQGWLLTLQAIIGEATRRKQCLVLSCSALKRRYRDLLRIGDPALVFIHLQGARELIAARMAQRPGHFMPQSLLDSQLRDLEPLAAEENGIVLDISKEPERLVDELMPRLAACGKA
ncbi:MAG: carbohydrate kinase, thermoresistant glucokinase family protein [Paucimonas sp.]|nr:carbohydrate kinase, thermoresistant glucokinase family protein [Paucimonas sp.]